MRSADEYRELSPEQLKKLMVKMDEIDKISKLEADTQEQKINWDIFADALSATSVKRKTVGKVKEADDILDAVQNSMAMEKQWEHYRDTSSYVGNISWKEVTDNVKKIYGSIENIR